MYIPLFLDKKYLFDQNESYVKKRHGAFKCILNLRKNDNFVAMFTEIILVW